MIRLPNFIRSNATVDATSSENAAAALSMEANRTPRRSLSDLLDFSNDFVGGLRGTKSRETKRADL